MTRWTIPTDAPAPVPGKPRDTHEAARALSDAVYAHMSAQSPREPADAAGTIRHLRDEVASWKMAATECELECKALRERVAELEACLDAAERDSRISDNGNMWRFWSDQAREANARAKVAEASVSKFEAALAQIADQATMAEIPEGYGPEDRAEFQAGYDAAVIAARVALGEARHD